MHCWGCNRRWHHSCIGTGAPAEGWKGPWHCRECKQHLHEQGIRDVTLDRVLIKYLVDGVLPGDKVEWKRLKCAAGFLHIDECGSLWAMDEVTQVKRYIAPIADHEAIVTDALHTMGFLKG